MVSTDTADTTGTLSARRSATRESQGKFITRLPGMANSHRSSNRPPSDPLADIPMMPRWLGWR